MFRLLITLHLALLGVQASAYAETQLQRGDYLVNAVMACDACHTPAGPNGPVMERRFSGGPQTWKTPAYTVKGSNITPDQETGIGTWTADDVKRLLTDGIRPTGVPLSPQMPYAFYKIMTQEDLDAVVSYVRSVPPVRNEVALPSYDAAMHTELVPGGDKPIDRTLLGDPAKRGFYLATIAHCMECHSKGADGALNFQAGLGKGGYEMKGPFGSVTVPNITSHPTRGVGSWSDAELKRALTHGVRRDGSVFKPPMARQRYYSRMADEDLDAIVAWMRTLPSL